jgi:hypothetical protein
MIITYPTDPQWLSLMVSIRARRSPTVEASVDSLPQNHEIWLMDNLGLLVGPAKREERRQRKEEHRNSDIGNSQEVK